MDFSVIIPTNREPEKLRKILSCLTDQTLQPVCVFLIVDKIFNTSEDQEEYRKTITEEYKSLTLEIIFDKQEGFKAHTGVSAARNAGTKKVRTTYTQFFDDDVAFGKDFFQVQWNIFQKNKKEHILIPQITYADTGKVRSYGISYFNYLLGWPIAFSNHLRKTIIKPQMCTSVSLFGKTQRFQKFPYDERFEFIMEDYDASHQRYRNKIELIINTSNTLQHRERQKNFLEKSYLWTPFQCYQKAKNRILFVQKRGNSNQKTMFRLFGSWIQMIHYTLRIFLYIPNKRGRANICSLREGRKDGIKGTNKLKKK